MVHISLHFIIPYLVAASLYRANWRAATVAMCCTMIVDLDHLLAVPIYDPNRCSIHFHPLHTTPAILLYISLTILPLIALRLDHTESNARRWTLTHWIGAGLLIHMMLDWGDCYITIF